MKLVWDPNAWEDYLWWQAQDRRVLKRINQLIRDVIRNGNEGIGKPEPLKHDFAGYWSRRITEEHRLVYKIAEDEIRIAACRYQYGRSREWSRQIAALPPLARALCPISDIMSFKIQQVVRRTKDLPTGLPRVQIASNAIV